MVYLVDGIVHPGHKPKSGDEYDRAPSAFAAFDVATAQKWATDHPDEKLFLYVCSACPWAHRANIARTLLDLEDRIILSVVEPLRNDDVGWEFRKEDRGGTHEMNPTTDKRGTGFGFLHQVYSSSCPNYTGNITTPLLTDSKGSILSNQSWDIARALVCLTGDQNHPWYPIAETEEAATRRGNIDKVAKWIQDDFNNGVYRAGLAKSQEAHEDAVEKVFAVIDALEARLEKTRFLLPGAHPTVADWQLFASLIRFDDIYGPLFKCMLRRLSTYDKLHSYLADLLQSHPAVQRTLHQRDTITHYWKNFTSSNPNGVVPMGTHIEGLHTLTHNRAAMAIAIQASNVTREMAGESQEQDQTNKAEEQIKGNFVRGVSGFRDWVEPVAVTEGGGGAIAMAGAGDAGGPPGAAGGAVVAAGETRTEPLFPLEAGRYHLYVANNCPWCHRVTLARSILGLEDAVSMDVCFYRRDEPTGAWQFLPDDSALRPHEVGNEELLRGISSSDSVNGKRLIPEIYAMCGTTERSVPILFDKKRNTIVNNESSEIVRMFGTVFLPLSRHAKGVLSPAPHLELPGSLYPQQLAWLIDEVNTWVYTDIANGAYRAGFSSTQEAHEAAAIKYFAGFSRANEILSRRKFLCGDRLTEADVRLFPPVYRHDAVYYMRMKLSHKMVRDYPHLHRWLELMKDVPGVQAGSRLAHCVHGYFGRTGAGLVPTIVLSRDNFY
jgi:putative glutathione S-transferase